MFGKRDGIKGGLKFLYSAIMGRIQFFNYKILKKPKCRRLTCTQLKKFRIHRCLTRIIIKKMKIQKRWQLLKKTKRLRKSHLKKSKMSFRVSRMTKKKKNVKSMKIHSTHVKTTKLLKRQRSRKIQKSSRRLRLWSVRSMTLQWYLQKITQFHITSHLKKSQSTSQLVRSL